MFVVCRHYLFLNVCSKPRKNTNKEKINVWSYGLEYLCKLTNHTSAISVRLTTICDDVSNCAPITELEKYTNQSSKVRRR